jgi:3'-5' exoribonuclease
VQILSIPSLKQSAQQGRVKASFHAQVEALQKKETRDGKPFWELTAADAEGKLVLRAWSDAPSFGKCASLQARDFLEVTGEFTSGNYGVESKDWNCRSLNEEERLALLAGPPELRARQAADYQSLVETVETIADPRLRALGRQFFAQLGERFRRTAAARVNHHARRGGLVEHVAQMMRSAVALAGVYPRLNRDLLLCGVLFHDVGKLWENVYESAGFTMPYTERGELMGHIPIGIEYVNAAWRKLLETEEAKAWKTTAAENELARLHLLHLIAAHHGELAFGSPVVPKTPEAWALHYVDNLDAKLEMIMQGYAVAKPLNPDSDQVLEKVWPLPSNIVAQLPPWTEPAK